MTDALEKCVLFNGIDCKSKALLLKALKAYSKKYSKNKTVISPCESVSKTGVVISGHLRAERLDINGNTIILSELACGDIFGEALSSIDYASDISVKSTEDSEVLWLDVSGLSLSDEASLCFMHNLVKSLSQKILYFNSRINILSKKTIRERVLTYLHGISNNNSIITVPFSRNEMADFLGTDRTALSRELSKMKTEGIIDFDRNSFKLSNAYREK